MTLKQKLFKQEIQNPENGYNIAKCMRKVGYKLSTTRDGSTYNRLRKTTQEIFSPDKSKRKILKAQKLFKTEKDNTNYARMIELEARICVPELRKQDITTNQAGNIVIIDKQSLTDKPKEIQPIDTTKVIDNVST